MIGDGPDPDDAVGEGQVAGPRWSYKRYVITSVVVASLSTSTLLPLSLTFEPVLDIPVSGVD